MGYIVTKRYVIDVETREDLVQLALSQTWGEDEMNELAKLFERDDVTDAEIADHIVSAQAVGNLTDVCHELDMWVKGSQNVRPYFRKYSIDDIKEYKAQAEQLPSRHPSVAYSQWLTQPTED